MAEQHRDPEAADDANPEGTAEAEDESVIEELRGSGVGLEDPNIVSDADTSDVDAHIQEDEPPVV